MIITTSFPGYDIRISEATFCPKVKKPYTPGEREGGHDEQRSGEHVMEKDQCLRSEPTRQRVDEQTEKHGENRDHHPMEELLVLHTAVDCYTCFMALHSQTQNDSL